MAKLAGFSDMVVDGHAPGLSGRPLQAYVAAGIGSDHECTSRAEALEKLRLGMTIFIREGSVARNLDEVIPLVTTANQHRFCFCTDDCQPADLLDKGHIDYLVRRAIAAGLDPITAIRMATWNAASYFRLHDRGAITPGRRADMVAFDDLRQPRPRLVFRGGREVAADGRLTAPMSERKHRGLRRTMNVAWENVDFRIPLEASRAHVIGAHDGSLVTDDLVDAITGRNGFAAADPGRDLLLLAVIERHMASGRVGKGFVRGIGLARGAIASSVAHDHHNLIVAGADESSMQTAARRVAELQGGMVVADGTAVVADVPLPLAGLMSTEPVEVVRRQFDHALAAARALGSPLHDPFMTLSFLGLEVIPRLKLTDQGLVDVERFQIVPLWLD
jgi:adenine deaminase